LALYLKLAPAFCQDIQKQASLLQRHAVGTDLEEVRRVLHTLKGLGGTMGAGALADAATSAEAAWAAGPEADQALVRNVTDVIGHTVLQMQALLNAHGTDAQAASSTAGASDTGHALLQKLQALLEASDMAALDVHAELLAVTQGWSPAELLPLNKAVNAFEFDQAASACRHLLKKHFP
jgi:HPt (histidine-containing phosphotransfer) domain-containing protein